MRLRREFYRLETRCQRDTELTPICFPITRSRNLRCNKLFAEAVIPWAVAV